MVDNEKPELELDILLSPVSYFIRTTMAPEPLTKRTHKRSKSRPSPKSLSSERLKLSKSTLFCSTTILACRASRGRWVAARLKKPRQRPRKRS